MKNITLKQLRYFEALARHRHFGRAAADCAISQPALSMQIKELEELLGSPLLEKNARPLRLTAFGEEFSNQSSDILRAVKGLGEFAQAARSRPIGTLRIGVIPTVAPYVLPTMIKDLAAHFPDLEIKFKETVTANLIQDIIEGSLDKALAFCKATSAQPRDLMSGSSLSTLVQMVSAGIGVTLIPEMALAVEQRSASVSVSPFDPPRPSRTIGMIWRKRNPLKDHFEQISKFIRKPA